MAKKDTFEELTKNAMKIYDRLKEKAGQVVDETKRIAQLAKLKNGLEKTEQLLGARCYILIKKNKITVTDTEIKEYAEDIDELKCKIEQLESGNIFCKKCNTANPSTAKFCASCGKEL